MFYIKKHVKDTFLGIYCILKRREPHGLKKSFKPIFCKQINNYIFKKVGVDVWTFKTYISRLNVFLKFILGQIRFSGLKLATDM